MPRKYSSHFSILFSGILYVLCFPVSYHTNKFFPEYLSSILVWITFVPVLLSLDFSNPKDCFKKGYFFGLLFNAGVLFWIIMAMKKYGGMSTLLSASILVLLVAFLALYPAVSFYLTARYARGTFQRVLLGALFFSIFDWTLAFFPFGGCPWANPAYALYGAVTFIQALDVVGIHGFNFIILFSNFLLAEYLRDKNASKALRGSYLAALLSIVTCFIYGACRLTAIEEHMQTDKPLSVALIQGNISQDLKWVSETRDKIIQTYAQLSSRATQAQPVDLVVWPEASIPFALNKDAKLLPFAVDYLKDSQLVFGSATYEQKSGKYFYLNSSFLADSHGNLMSRYDKQHLVPFGEYVPLQRWIGWFVPAAAGNFSGGNEPILFSIHGHLFSTVICYESLFPEISRDMVRKGASFLLNLTNDAWFDYTSGPFQHAHFGRFRAIETRRSFLRAANTGVSYWLDPTGKIHDETDLFETKVVLAKAYPLKIQTFYVHFPWMIPSLMLIALCFILIRNERYGDKTHP